MGCLGGCLKRIITIIILIFAFIGVKSVWKPSEAQKAQTQSSIKIVDFSRLSDEFNLDKVINLPNFKIIIVKHSGSGQKFIITNSTFIKWFTQKDFTSKEIDKKIADFAENTQYQFIRLEDIKIIQRGTISTLNLTIPYVRFTADTVNFPAGEIQGIIGAVTSEDSNITILTYNNSKKYSQIITEQFFKNVSLYSDL